MIPQETERDAVQADERYIDTGKIERTAGYSVGLYINRSPQIVPYILMNDKTPIWDGELFIYNSKKSLVKNFSARIPLQVKGTTNTKDDFYRIGREYLESYKNDGGCLFFLVQVDENFNPLKILYALLSLEETKSLLLQRTKTIKIKKLKIVSKDPIEFQKVVIKFAEHRKSEKNENSAPKEIEKIVNYFKEIEKDVEKIQNKEARLDLKSLLKSILTLSDDGTIGWRDGFIYYSQKAIELAIKNIRDYDFSDLQFVFGSYLHLQKQYHLVEDYYIKALEAYRELTKNNSEVHKGKMALLLDNLASLHSVLNCPEKAEKEYEEAFDIWLGLTKKSPGKYIRYLIMSLTNLASLHAKLSHLDEAEEKYMKALDIYKKLAKDNPGVFIDVGASILNNLANLHQNLNRPEEAEKEYEEALDIYKKPAKENPAAYLGGMAMVLNNLASLHANLNRPEEAEKEYEEALDIYNKLAKDNPGTYLGKVAMTLYNFAALNENLNRPEEAEKEYEEALDIYKGLAKDNPAIYMSDVANTLSSLAYLYASRKDFVNAIDAIDQAIALMPEDAIYYDSKGEILLMNGEEQGAVEMWLKVMELDPNFLTKHNGETELHRQLKERGLIEE